jgi:uncharacterized protein (DUF488 family)
VLGEAGVAWEHFEQLGGRRSPLGDSPNRGWDNEQFRGYADHMASPGFQAALERLLALAVERRPAVMCAEADWRRCHRRLLSDALLTRGVEVLHVDPGGGASPHELTSFAVVEDGVITYPPVQGDLGV